MLPIAAEVWSKAFGFDQNEKAPSILPPKGGERNARDYAINLC
jgi:hypothetical protein